MNDLIDRDLTKYPPPNTRIPRDNPYGIPYTIDRGIPRAKCPKCGRITTIRTCYGCRELMCQDCLTEHQIICLHKPEDSHD